MGGQVDLQKLVVSCEMLEGALDHLPQNAVWLVNVSKWQCACKEDIEIQVTDDTLWNQVAKTIEIDYCRNKRGQSWTLWSLDM